MEDTPARSQYMRRTVLCRTLAGEILLLLLWNIIVHFIIVHFIIVHFIIAFNFHINRIYCIYNLFHHYLPPTHPSLTSYKQYLSVTALVLALTLPFTSDYNSHSHSHSHSNSHR